MSNIVRKAMDEINAQQYSWAGWGRVSYETASPTEVAGCFSSLYEWDGCAGHKLSSTRYWIVDKDGTFEEVPYRYEDYEYASNHDPDYHEENDIYVADFITENTIAVIRRERTYIDVEGRDYEDTVETTVFLLQPISEKEEREIRDKLIQKIKTLPITSLLSLLERVGDYD